MNEFSYELTREEVRSALYLMEQLRRYARRSAIEAAVAGVLFVINLICVIADPTYSVGYVCMAALLIVALAAIFMPRRNERQTVQQVYESVRQPICITPEDGALRIRTGSADWRIEGESLSAVRENEQIIALMLRGSRFVAVPKRALCGDELIKFKDYLESMKTANN